jgi:hypothetical protein
VFFSLIARRVKYILTSKFQSVRKQWMLNIVILCIIVVIWDTEIENFMHIITFDHLWRVLLYRTFFYVSRKWRLFRERMYLAWSVWLEILNNFTPDVSYSKEEFRGIIKIYSGLPTKCLLLLSQYTPTLISSTDCNVKFTTYPPVEAELFYVAARKDGYCWTVRWTDGRMEERNDCQIRRN